MITYSQCIVIAQLFRKVVSKNDILKEKEKQREICDKQTY